MMYQEHAIATPPLPGAPQDSAPPCADALPSLEDISRTQVHADDLVTASHCLASAGADLHRAHLADLVAMLRGAMPHRSDLELATAAVRVCALDRLLQSGSAMRAWVHFDDVNHNAYVPAAILEFAGRAPLLMRDDCHRGQINVYAGFDSNAFIASLLAKSKELGEEASAH